MRPEQANEVVEILRGWGIAAHVLRVGSYQHGVSVVLDRETEAVWDTDGASGLEAQILGNGKLVGLVPEIAGADTMDLTSEQLARLIADADYGRPIVRLPGVDPQ